MSSVDTGGSREDLEERHRRALEELEEARERWRLILETANDAYIAIDAESRILDWNARAEELLGWPADEAIGRRLSDTVIPERFRDAHHEGIERYRRTGEGPVLFQRLELPALHREGHEIVTEITIWPSPHADGQRFNAFLRDVRGRRRMERDSRLQQRVTAAANATSDVRTALTAAIAEICETVGWPVGHVYLRDEDDTDRVVPTDWWYVEDDGFAAFQGITEGSAFLRGRGLPGRVLETGEPAWIVDVAEDPNFPRHGVAHQVGLRTGMAFPVLSGDRVVAVLEFFSRERSEPDVPLLELMRTIGTQLGRVAERQSGREQLERTNEELEQANETKTRLVSVVSHELRSPLTAIHGFSDLLLEDWTVTPDEEWREIVDSIRRQSRRLFRLVDDLLTLSRLESRAVEARKGTVRVADAIAAVAADLGFAEDLEIDGPEDATAEADQDHVTQILVNLLTNARRYGSPPYRVEVRRGASGPDPHVDVRVCDAGEGVDPDFVPRLFDPFTRGRVTDGEGTGLGLSIVAGLVAANAGEVWYEALDPGSCFAVRLPAAP